MKKILIIICFIGLLMGFTHCSKDDSKNETIVLLGEEGYVPPLMDLIPDTMHTTFPTHFGDFFEGYIPPNIEGEYQIDNKFSFSNIFQELNDTLEMHLKISDQHNRIATIELDEGGIVHTDTAYIMGSEPCFTLYFVEDRDRDFSGFHYIEKHVVVFSGEKTDAGIKDLRTGFITLVSNESNNNNVTGLPPGCYFVYYDLDNISENCNWFDP